jgi:hypothetical protein
MSPYGCMLHRSILALDAYREFLLLSSPLVTACQGLTQNWEMKLATMCGGLMGCFMYDALIYVRRGRLSFAGYIPLTDHLYFRPLNRLAETRRSTNRGISSGFVQNPSSLLPRRRCQPAKIESKSVKECPRGCGRVFHSSASSKSSPFFVYEPSFTKVVFLFKVRKKNEWWKQYSYRSSY